MKYKDAGVDFKTLGQVKQRMKRLARGTYTPAVLSEIGLFGGLFEMKGYTKPVLVSSTDSVGTKILVATMAGQHKSVGLDIVNHCTNDILTLGAKPLFFLDYIAYAELEPMIIGEVFEGMAAACRRERIALIGGETAQLPGFYPAGLYDLVGFVIGVIEKGKIIDGRKIRPGNILIGFRSSGLHTNGYSLAREVLFRRAGYTVDSYLPELKNTIGQELLRPHVAYGSRLLPHLGGINGMAHITGGGLYENIARILPSKCRAVIFKKRWPVPPIFDVIQQHGNIPEREMYTVFNMGIGMVAVVDRRNVGLFRRIGGLEIGHVEKGTKEVKVV